MRSAGVQVPILSKLAAISSDERRVSRSLARAIGNSHVLAAHIIKRASQGHVQGQPGLQSGLRRLETLCENVVSMK